MQMRWLARYSNMNVSNFTRQLLLLLFFTMEEFAAKV